MSHRSALPSRPHLEIMWNDRQSEAHGWVVIDTLSRGVASGGLRMRSGCTVEEVRGLAHAMTLKEAVHFKDGMRYVPVGGAKGGINYDPQAPDADQVLERFLIDINPLIQHIWALGEDFGVRQETIDDIYERQQLGSPVQAVHQLVADIDASEARQAHGFSLKVDGTAQSELVGGLGVAQSALTALKHYGYDPTQSRAVIQGFGSMGGATAKFLAEADVSVVGIADDRGFIVNPSGLDVHTLFASRDRYGRMDRSALPEGTSELPRDEWLKAECEVLIPAALSGVITATNQSDVRAPVIVEAANLPVTPDAEALLAQRGVHVIPDFVANSGTNAWWWWLVFGDIDGSWPSSERMVTDRLSTLTSETLELSRVEDSTPRAAALQLVTQHLQLML